MTYCTLKLDKAWDLTLDGEGNLAIVTTPAAVAQDVASACLVFMGECYFDRSLGIPWKEEVLGRRPTAGFIAQKLQVEAEKLPVVNNQAIASVRLDKASRKLRGVIRVTDNENNRLEVIL